MTENPHVDASCPGIGEADEPARVRIVSSGMMGGVAFTSLKAGRPGPKSAKQVEIRLAILPKILHIGAGSQNFLARAAKDVRLFGRLWRRV
jgi:hypothetical protein